VTIDEIRGKDSRELKLDVQALRKELFGLHFRGAAEEISHTSRFRAIRRTIARINTVLRQREIAAVQGQG
jgi:large subunit ribosomal protein L29